MRIVALSDQHGELPDVPPCDLLVIAGDNCPDYPPGAKDRVGSGPQTARQRKWFETEWLAWRNRQPADLCIATFGNHDYCGEQISAGRSGSYCLDGRTAVAVDSAISVGGIQVWLTPWSSQFRDWAFMKTEEELAEIYARIPAMRDETPNILERGVDILVSHQPPYGYGDTTSEPHEHLGSPSLLAAIDRVQPKVVICGHLHGGFGHYQRNGTAIYNVALLDEQYRMVRQPTVIEL